MTKCPICQNEISKSGKTWNFGLFMVDAYLCDKCQTKFRDYMRDGKYSFTLQLEQGKYRKKHDKL